MKDNPGKNGNVGPKGNMAKIVQRNIKALLDRRHKEEKEKRLEQKIADRVANFVGRLNFVYVHILFFGAWIACNEGLFGLHAFDPKYTGLQLTTSIEAIFLTTFVLISQNSMNKQADNRADLDLQVSLLAEHEITRLISMVTAISKKLDIEEGFMEEMEELAQDVEPEKVMDTMEEHKESLVKNGESVLNEAP
ncbi:MAG: rane protein [Segetibacter sp.]|nr:rane protein [Segetibacter sp.]